MSLWKNFLFWSFFLREFFIHMSQFFFSSNSVFCTKMSVVDISFFLFQMLPSVFTFIMLAKCCKKQNDISKALKKKRLYGEIIFQWSLFTEKKKSVTQKCIIIRLEKQAKNKTNQTSFFFLHSLFGNAKWYLYEKMQIFWD